MKRVGACYLRVDRSGIWAYDVADTAKVGDVIVDEHNRVAVIVEAGSVWDGRTLEAEVVIVGTPAEMTSLVLGVVFVALIVAGSFVLAFLVLLPVAWIRRRRWRRQAAADRRHMRELRERALQERRERRRRLGQPPEPWL